MSSRFPRFLLLPVLFLLAAVSRADAVTDWNSAALDAIRAGRAAPPVAARALAILHVAIYDAVNGITQSHQPYFVTGKPAGVASVEAAAAAAAHRRWSLSFRPGRRNSTLCYTAQLGALPDGPSERVGVAWGEFVADEILTLRSTDHSDAVVPYAPKPGAGFWAPTPPANAPALLPQWPMVTPFAMTDPSQFRPPAPPSLDSALWIRDYNLTKDLGSLSSALRTEEQTAIARFWADGAGTVTPPGHWNVIAQDVAAQRGTSLEEKRDCSRF